MENFENQVFGFGANESDGLEQATNFNYNSISGLGESNYENEDLFVTDNNINTLQETNNLTENFESANNPTYNFNNFDYRIGSVEENNQVVQDNVNSFSFDQSQDIFFNSPVEPTAGASEQLVSSSFEPMHQNIEQPHLEETSQSIQPESFNNSLTEEHSINEIVPFQSEPQQEDLFENNKPDFISLISNLKPLEEETIENTNEDVINNIEEREVKPELIEEINQTDKPSFVIEEEVTNEQPHKEEVFENEQVHDETVVEEKNEESQVDLQFMEDEEEILISDTPIEELEKLTKYNDEYIENTDINSLFNKVSVNVQDASEIFRKNTDMKAKIDTRFEELKKLQSEVESSKQKQLDEINKYKEEVLEKLTEKKEEIEKRLNTLKEYQANLEKEKLDFEKYKKSEQANIDKVQKEVQAAYDDRREELNNIEDSLRRQKDELDEERSQLSLDRIQYEADKNELANNLLKFNELVNSFTNGVNSAGRE